ncbi:Fe-S cluster assembly protein SufD [Brevundimonas sp. 2R-24]|uniref:Fe-S cluster assembly protein SufD n=1 Tax=Peiella sedimenti TaxID=3061083 RepID=A0ABT8SLV9_9CAUL|nr:Fe-S cluster assembly protein SufD [Caulobacteraceae bacterium XZ-24]
MTPARLDITQPETWPNRRVEDWRWTDVARVLREAPPPSPQASVEPGGPFAGLGGDELAVVNGRAPADARIIADGPGQVARLRFVSATDGTGHQARIIIEVKPGADLLLLESQEGAAAGYVANHILDIDVGAGGRLTRIVLAADAADALAFTRADVTMGGHAAFAQTVLTTGAKLQRIETRVSHPGKGASVRLDGLYLLSGERHADATSEVDHTGLDGQTSQLTKGVVRERGRGVFQGRIIVREGADGTDARMGHHALILGDRGEVDAKPELEIYADDVACAHGNTVGALDEMALFYLRSRGVPEAEARALLTEAFLGEALDRIEREDVREVCRAWLAERLSSPPPSSGAERGRGTTRRVVEGAAQSAAPDLAPSTASRSPSPAGGGGEER